jgi:hypothetical protein
MASGTASRMASGTSSRTAASATAFTTDRPVRGVPARPCSRATAAGKTRLHCRHRRHGNNGQAAGNSQR